MEREEVVLLEREDRVVALVAEHCVEVGDLHELLPFDVDRRDRDVDLGGVAAAERVPEPRAPIHIRLERGVRWRVSRDDDRDIDVVETEEALVGRLVAPDRLHVEEDVVLDVNAKAVDLGDLVVMRPDRCGKLVDRGLQRAHCDL